MVRTNLIPPYLFGDLVVNLMEIVVKYLLYYSKEDVMFLMEKLRKFLYSGVNMKKHM